MANEKSLVTAVIGIVIIAFAVGGIMANSGSKSINTGKATTSLTCTETDASGQDTEQIPTRKDPVIDRTVNPGLNVFTKGTTTLGTTSKTDYCKGYETLVEYFCGSRGNFREVNYNCWNSTMLSPKTMICENGKCVQTPCLEDDEGRDPTKAGFTYGFSRTTKSYVSGKDTCENSKNLREYYCTYEGIKAEVETCKYGCVSGKCHVPTTIKIVNIVTDFFKIVSFVSAYIL